MESTDFKNSRSKSTLSFKDQILEEKYKRERYLSTRNLFVKFVIILSVYLICFLLFTICWVFLGNTSNRSIIFLMQRLYYIPISLLILLIEYLMMKYDIRMLRGILFILRCFVLMAIDPREEDGAPRSYR